MRDLVTQNPDPNKASSLKMGGNWKVGFLTLGFLKSSYDSFALVAHSCPTLCDLMDCSPPRSSVHGISQAGILEWIAISFTG